jgi:hypothetical protein
VSRYGVASVDIACGGVTGGVLDVNSPGADHGAVVSLFSADFGGGIGELLIGSSNQLIPLCYHPIYIFLHVFSNCVCVSGVADCRSYF